MHPAGCTCRTCIAPWGEGTGSDNAYAHDMNAEYKRGAEEALRRAFDLAKGRRRENPIQAVIETADEFGVRL